jgi:hypothetical protein
VDIGDAFLLIDDRIDEHLWIVISLPGDNPDAVVIVSLTTRQDWKDQSCILGPADHPWIKHETCVSYRDARCVAEIKLDELIAKAQLRMLATASDELLGKILAGAELTEDLPLKCSAVLIKQNLIRK